MRDFIKSFNGQAVLLVLATAVVYGLCINNLNLWSDEIYSVLMAKDSLLEMWRLLITEDSKPPLYYLYLKGIMALFPQAYEIWAAHFASFILLIGAQIFALTAVRRDFGDKIALWMAALFALMPCSLWLAFEVRTYMLSALLLFMALIYGLRLLETPWTADFVKFGVVTVLALYSHYYCAIWLMFLYAGILFCLIREKKFAIYSKKFLFTAGGAAVLFAPWLIVPLSTGGDISRFWYVNRDFVTVSPMFFLNPFEPEILQSSAFMATFFVTAAFSFVVWCGVFVLISADCKIKRLFWFAVCTFLCCYLLLIVLSDAIRPMVTARYLKIFALVWYLAGAVVLAEANHLGRAFGAAALLLFGFSYTDIREVSFDKGYTNAVHDIRTFIPKKEKLIVLDNSNLFCEYYLPEYTCLAAVNEYGEILRLPSILKHIDSYTEDISDTTFTLSLYNETTAEKNCLTYPSIYRRGQNLHLCKISKPVAAKLLDDSLNLRLKIYETH